MRRVLIGFLMFCLIVLRWAFSDAPSALPLDEIVEFDGWICDEPDVRRNGIKLTVCMDDVDGRVLVTVLRYPKWEYGDRVRVDGVLTEPPEFDGFSYGNYLKRYGIYRVMYRPRIDKRFGIGVGDVTVDGFFTAFGRMRVLFFRGLFRVKTVVEGRLRELLPEPAASLAAGLLLGSRSGMSDSLARIFQDVGLTHIVAISGYNISLVIVFMNGILGFLGRRARVAAAVAGIFVFSVLVGASAAVVRAALMGSLGLLALWYGRTSRVLITILASALVMALWNPYIPLYDVGFQLSFAATLGLVYVSPSALKWFSRIPEMFGLRESLALTVSAQIAASPVILWHFGRISLISPVANMFVLPFIPLAMLFSALALAVSFVSNMLALLIAWYGWLFLMCVIWLAQFFALLT